MNLKVEVDGDDVIVANDKGNYVAIPIQVIRSGNATIHTESIGGPPMPEFDRQNFAGEAWDAALSYADAHNLR